MGRRPCLPDSVPVIGRLKRADNVVVAFGHQHLGLTMGPITGRLVADIVTGAPPVVDPGALPARAVRVSRPCDFRLLGNLPLTRLAI